VTSFPRITPIIPVRRSAPFEHADWVYELKYDGFRALAYVSEGQCRLISRRGNQLKRFEALCGSIPIEVKANNAVIDGEVVALGASGMPALYDLLKRRSRIVYFAFDLLWMDGEDLHALPLLQRKRLLRSIIPRKSPWVGYVNRLSNLVYALRSLRLSLA
jgi:bifunctional non-homologous end joining protein LigD